MIDLVRVICHVWGIFVYACVYDGSPLFHKDLTEYRSHRESWGAFN